MSHPGFGLVLEGLRQPVKEALRTASELSFRQVELPVTSGEVEPSQLSATGRRHLAHYVRNLGLDLAALGGDPGGARFADPSHLDQQLSRTRRILELARDLKVPIVTTQLGRLPETDIRQGAVGEAVRHLAELADRTGVRVALETAAGSPETIARLLRETGCPLLGVCYDPGSLLIDGYDPLGGVEHLADNLIIARARDAIGGNSARPGREAPLGQGQIDFRAYLQALEQAGYARAAFIRRVHAERPAEELADARSYLDGLV